MILMSHQFNPVVILEVFFVSLAIIFFIILKKYNAKNKQTAKISAVKKILTNIQKNFDITEIKKNAAQNIAKELKADRCFILEYDENLKKFSNKIEVEYNSFENIKPVSEDFPETILNHIVKNCLDGKTIKIPDVQKYIKNKQLKGTLIEDFYNEYNIKSEFYFPIKHLENIIGVMVLQFVKKKSALSKVDIEFVENIIDSVSIFVYQTQLYIAQVKLYEKQKETAEREALLRNTVETIRNTLDVNQVKKTIVTEYAKVFGAMRVFMIDLDIETGKAKPMDEYSEYLASSDEVSYVGLDFTVPDFDRLANTYKGGKTIVVKDKEEFNKFIYEFNLQNTPYGKAVLASVVESGITSPIIYEGQLYSTLTIQYKEKKHFTEDEIKFIQALGNQVGLALYQARLYEKQTKTAERETLLRNTVETIRSTLDIEKIKNKIVTEIGKLLKADRVFIIEYDSKNKGFVPISQNSEYLSSQKVKSMVGLNIETMEELAFLKSAYSLGVDLIYPNINKLLEEKKTENGQIINFIKSFGISSAIITNITYGQKFLGNLVIHYSQERGFFTEDELQYVKTIANQVGIGIYQSVLFNKLKQHAKKESILRHIIAEIKFSSSLEQAYLKLLGELSKIYNLNRVLFLESSPQNRTDLIIKSEFVINKSDLQVNNLVFPQVCIDDFLSLINNFETLVINNVLDCYPDEETMKFFRKYKIKSLMATPLVKQSKNITVFGFVILCGEKPREWSAYEIELLKSISESVISVLWEICKFNEIEDLRNSFVLTLAHDFQVPLIAERNALEYLIKYDSDKIGNDSLLLNEILENNNNIIKLLEKSVDIYDYESGKKELDLSICNIQVLSKEAIEYIQEYAIAKSVMLELNCKEKNIFVNIDKLEILKVLHIIIENAIEKSPENSKVLLNVRKIADNVEIFIKDFGSGIPEEIQKKIFNRYEMALAIERKIGAGTGLFLSKRIIEAHNGQIYFDTNPKKGTIFYIILPIYELPKNK